MSEPNREGSSDMIRFGEAPGPEITSFGEGVPAVGQEVFGPPVAEGFVPPAAAEPEELKDAKRAKGKSAKKKKEKRGKKEKKERSAAEKKGPPRLLLLVAIIALAFVIAIVVLLLILKPWAPRSSGDAPPKESASEPAETEEPSQQPSPEPTPTPAPTPTPQPQEITVQEGVDFVRELSPSVLGLEGESMDAYGVFSGERVVLVDGIPCMEVDVYSDENATGSNDIQGRFLLSRTAPRRLFRLDTNTKEVTEVPLNGVG